MKPQLFILHHAGGNCYSYQFLLPYLAGVFDVVVTELPGRGKRILQKLVDTPAAAVEDLAAVIAKQLNGQPFLLYGHSMGALLTPAIVQRLLQTGKYPLAAMVTGCATPEVNHGLKRHCLPHDELAEILLEMGGITEEYFQSPDLVEFFDPIVRADFKIAETETLAEDIPTMDIPVYAIMGSNEPGNERIKEWQTFTTGEFRSEIMEGGHFFIHQHPKALADRIKNCYDRYLVHQNG